MRARHAALALVVCSGLALFVSGLYGIASPFVAGHYGYHGGEYSTRARNTIRHGSIVPVNEPTFSTPRPEQYYLHHPVLTHHLVTLTLTLLGDHEYSVRAAGLLGCFACFLLLARLIWVHWGPWQAAAAAATFVIVPINVWFANHIDPGYPSIAALLAFCGFYLRWLKTERWRDAVGALLFAALAGGFEWSPYLAAVPIFLHALWTGIARRGRFLGFVPLYGLAVVLPLAVHALIVWNTGHIAEMQESFGVRTAGGLSPFFYRLSFDHGIAMFGGPLLLAGGLWLLLLIGRLVSRRGRARDLIGVSFVCALLLYIHVFRAGALVHAYRYLYGGIVCAIAVCDLAEMLSEAVSTRVRRHAVVIRAAVAAAVAGGILGATTQTAHTAWLESRMKGGSPFLEPYNPETAKVAFAQLVHDRSLPGNVLYVHPSFAYQQETVYYLDRDIQSASLAAVMALTPEQRIGALLLCVPSALSPEDRGLLARLAQSHPIWLVSGYLLLDLRRAGADVHAEEAVAPDHRTIATRYFEGPYSHMQRVPDPMTRKMYVQEFGVR